MDGKVLCIVLVMVGCLALLIGSLSPSWLSKSSTGYGLWFKCSSKCEHYNWRENSISGWFIALHVVLALDMLSACTLFVTAIYQLCGNCASLVSFHVLVFLTDALAVPVYSIFLSHYHDGDPIGENLNPDSIDWGFYCFFTGYCIIKVFGNVLKWFPEYSYRYRY